MRWFAKVAAVVVVIPLASAAEVAATSPAACHAFQTVANESEFREAVAQHCPDGTIQVESEFIVFPDGAKQYVVDSSLTVEPAPTNPAGRVVIVGRQQDRLFFVGPSTSSALVTLTLNDVVLTGGRPSSFESPPTSPFPPPSDFGGAIYSSNGHVVLNGSSVIWRNSASFGGGVYLFFGSLTLNDDSAIAHNFAEQRGGGIGGRDTNIKINDNGLLHFNKAKTGGGGVDTAFSAITLTGAAKVMNNSTATGGGGGISACVGGTVVAADDATISWNQAEFGGGAYVCTALSLGDRASVVGNVATRDGGGLYLTDYRGAAFSLGGSSRVRYNLASNKGGGVYYGATVSDPPAPPLPPLQLNDNASIRDNVATTGGGLYLDRTSVTLAAGAGITGNRYDDISSVT